MQLMGESSNDLSSMAQNPRHQSPTTESKPNSEEIHKNEKTILSQYIYQGNLYSFEEGFWGRGKFVEKYFVLEEGTLSFYSDEKSFLIN